MLDTRPTVLPYSMQDLGQDFVLVQPGQGLVYPSIAYVRGLVAKAGTKQGGGANPVILDCEAWRSIDYTASKVDALLKGFQIKKL